MGQAKARGTYEQRRNAAIERDQQAAAFERIAQEHRRVREAEAQEAMDARYARMRSAKVSKVVEDAIATAPAPEAP